jgi:ACR3 family arsenite transporter
MILLGVAPCTAMVLMWSYLAKGDMGHALVMIAIDPTRSKDNIQWLK